MKLLDLLLEIQALTPTVGRKEVIAQIQKKYKNILHEIKAKETGIVLRVLTDKVRKSTTPSSSSTEIQSPLLKSLIEDFQKMGWFPFLLTWSYYPDKFSYTKDKDKPWIKVELDNNHDRKYSVKKLNTAVANKEYKSIWIGCLANFDPEAKKLLAGKSKVYHATLKSNLDNILKRGIVPSNSGRYGPYPNRSYFGASKSMVADLFKSDEFRFKLKDAVFLEIDLKKIPNVKFYQDPESYGIYTYDKIPPDAIKVYRGG